MPRKKRVSKKANTKKPSAIKKIVGKEKVVDPAKAVVSLPLDREAVGRVFVKPKFNYLKAKGVK